MQQTYFLIVGGGFFGTRLSVTLAQKYGLPIVLLEKSGDLLQRASYVNQARVHNGYHYPRSLVTAVRSYINFPRFVKEYSDCVFSDFEKYYAVASINGKVTANQFFSFYQKIGAPIELAPTKIKNYFNDKKIEEVYTVQEYAFDAVKLKHRVRGEMETAKVDVRFQNEVLKVTPQADGSIIADVKDLATGEVYQVQAKYVFNCTYSGLNSYFEASNLPKIPLKQEMAEMCLVEPPAEFKDKGFTIMCGPYFSLMPFPSKGLHSFSHVRYTPHTAWYDLEVGGNNDDYFMAYERKTNFLAMQKDAALYMPGIMDLDYRESIWEVKTVLPASENDDSRPILFRKDVGIKNHFCILGGKIDNIFDMEAEISEIDFGTLVTS